MMLCSPSAAQAARSFSFDHPYRNGHCTTSDHTTLVHWQCVPALSPNVFRPCRVRILCGLMEYCDRLCQGASRECRLSLGLKAEEDGDREEETTTTLF